MSTMEWEIRRCRAGASPEEFTDRVVVELPLEIFINAALLVALMRTPGMDRELAVGFCLTEKVIRSLSQIKSLKHRGRTEQGLAAGRGVQDTAAGHSDAVEIEADSPRESALFPAAHVVRTGRGGADVSAVAGYREGEEYREGEITSELRMEEAAIYGLSKELTRRQDIFRSTGGTHGAGIFTAGGGVAVVAEDVGRHNALDKAVGWCALHQVPLEDKVLVLSGRVSYEMALKAARAGIPVLVSLAAPTSLGLRVAEAAGLTVAGFSDGRRFNVYTHPERIIP